MPMDGFMVLISHPSKEIIVRTRLTLPKDFLAVEGKN
jgi:hypothetical protein